MESQGHKDDAGVEEMLLRRSRLSDWLCEAIRKWHVDRPILETGIEEARKIGLDDVAVQTEVAITVREKIVARNIEVSIQKELKNGFDYWLESARKLGMEDLVQKSSATFRAREESVKLLLFDKATYGTRDEFTFISQRARFLGLTAAVHHARMILSKRVADIFSAVTGLADQKSFLQSKEKLEEQAHALGISRELLDHTMGQCDGTTAVRTKIANRQSREMHQVVARSIPLWSMMQNWKEMDQRRKRWQRSMETRAPEVSIVTTHSKTRITDASGDKSPRVEYDSESEEKHEFDIVKEMDVILCTPLILTRVFLEQKLGYSTYDLQVLTKLDLSNEGFSSLGNGVISECCPMIKLITCDMNRLTALKDAFSGCEWQVEYVSARNNFISDLSDLHDLSNLEILHLDGNNIVSLGLFSGQLVKAIDTGTHGNQNYCVKLKELTLSCNRIARISMLGTLYPYLQVLDLASNQLVTMDTALNGLKQLRVLDVGQNRLKGPSLWVALKNCPVLISLVASRNRLIELPTFPGSVLLRELWLNGNAIRKLSTMAWMPNLQRLYLQDNSIEKIEPLWGCPALEVLDLSFNSLSDLNQLRNLACFIHLRSLQLNDNPVSESVDYMDTVLKAVPWLIELDNEAITENRKDAVVKSIFLNVMELIGMQYLHEKSARNEIIFSESERPDEVQVLTIQCTTRNQFHQWFRHFPALVSEDENFQGFKQHFLPLRLFQSGSACWTVLWAALLEALQFEGTRSILASFAQGYSDEKGLSLSIDMEAKAAMLSNMRICLTQRDKLLLANKDLSSERDGFQRSTKEDITGRRSLDTCLNEHFCFHNCYHLQLMKTSKAARKIQSVWRRKTSQKLFGLSDDSSGHKYLAKVQALWRGYVLRKKLKGALAGSKYVDGDTFDYGIVDENISFCATSFDIVFESASSSQPLREDEGETLVHFLLSRINQSTSIEDLKEVEKANEVGELAKEWGFKNEKTVAHFMKACHRVKPTKASFLGKRRCQVNAGVENTNLAKKCETSNICTWKDVLKPSLFSFNN